MRWNLSLLLLGMVLSQWLENDSNEPLPSLSLQLQVPVPTFSTASFGAPYHPYEGQGHPQQNHVMQAPPHQPAPFPPSNSIHPGAAYYGSYEQPAAESQGQLDHSAAALAAYTQSQPQIPSTPSTPSNLLVPIPWANPVMQPQPAYAAQAPNLWQHAPGTHLDHGLAQALMAQHVAMSHGAMPGAHPLSSLPADVQQYAQLSTQYFQQLLEQQQAEHQATMAHFFASSISQGGSNAVHTTSHQTIAGPRTGAGTGHIAPTCSGLASVGIIGPHAQADSAHVPQSQTTSPQSRAAAPHRQPAPSNNVEWLQAENARLADELQRMARNKHKKRGPGGGNKCGPKPSASGGGNFDSPGGPGGSKGKALPGMMPAISWK